MKIIADENIPFVKDCFSSIGQVKLLSGRDIAADNVRDADILVVRSITKVNSDLLIGSSVKFVGTATIGTEHLDTEFLRKNNIAFASAPGSNADSVAEYVTAALLETAQKHKMNLQEKSIGIVGVGNIGGRVADKCETLDMNVLLNDPPLAEKTSEPKYLPIDVLSNCDFITIHTPLTFEGKDKTFHLADKNFFHSLKKGCVFINTARGAVVNTPALKNAIKSDHLKAAILDVWEDEPNIDTELLEMVDIGSAHIAGYSLDGKVNGMTMIYKAVCNYFDLKSQFKIDSFLPAPDIPEVKIVTKDKDWQNILLETVRKIYDIRIDDSNLRRILNLPIGKKCALFDQLRKDYPVRREFSNTHIILDSDNLTVKEKLAAVGFKV